MEKEKINAFITYLQSQQTSRQYLFHCYRNRDRKDAEIKSYENSSAFMYYLQHGMQFYETGKKMDPLIQPILFFYGLTHLIKALLLSTRPDYPESTSILAHGVSTRKRKKKQYTFLQDEVKTQQNGLFPYFTKHLYNGNQQLHGKWKMESLFAVIPEMNPMMQFANREKTMISTGKIGAEVLEFPLTILDQYHLTEEAFIMRIRPFLPTIKQQSVTKDAIQIVLASPINYLKGPFKINIDDEFVCFPFTRNVYFTGPETMIHYLLLYNLSMICRYETEWWGDLLNTKPEMDYPFITQFLRITGEKMPLLLGEELLEQYNFD
ncbi:YaaC family protein [Virgibacillus sp. W0181]|uniref:YaaC family protein n=1 Tax=Virgibacillus sp. W0181 TaxID=3391581 RepID=UPI003F44C06B